MLTSGRNLKKSIFRRKFAKVELSLHAKVVCKLLQLAQVGIINLIQCLIQLDTIRIDKIKWNRRKYAHETVYSDGPAILRTDAYKD